MNPNESQPNAVAIEAVEYVAPQIESVLLPEELEREVAYAGIQAGSPLATA